MRDIHDILRFRGDISPFLVHLTRNIGASRAETILKKIVSEKQLIAGDNEISDARFAMYTADMLPEERKKYFGAICFTETPLNEVHCLLEIKGRSVNLEPYGLLFLKENCAKRGVDPVLYINNNNGEKVKAMKALCSLIKTKPNEAANILPLLAIFGDRLTPPGAMQVDAKLTSGGNVNGDIFPSKDHSRFQKKTFSWVYVPTTRFRSSISCGNR